MASIPLALRRTVFACAGGRCEYCLLHNDDAFKPHEVDHIRAEKHGGETVESNLALSCYFCNRHKGADLTAIDPETDELTRLFHPRLDQWTDHFQIVGAHIIGLTAVGRATVNLLRMNTAERLVERLALIEVKRYP